MKTTFLILIAVFSFSHSAYSWGSKGHKIVVQIAKSRLDKSVIDSVDYYLDGVTWEDAAGWMDNVHDDRTYDFMKTWHYVNIEKDKTYVATTGSNIINELEFVIPAIKNRAKYDRKKTGMYLKILFHLMGDLHQPLHCGYREDRGGNEFDAIFDDKETNLHKIWDFEIIKHSNIDEKDCFRLIKTWTPEKITEIEKADILDCVNESRALLPQVYSIKKKANGAYIRTSGLAITQQLSKAGVRLASILDQSFKK